MIAIAGSMYSQLIFDVDGTMTNAGNPKFTLSREKLEPVMHLAPSKIKLPAEGLVFEDTNWIDKCAEAGFDVLNPEILSCISDLIADHFKDKIILYDWVSGLVRKLDGKVKLAILSNAQKKYILRILGNLAGFFRPIITYENNLYPKPNPYGIKYICKTNQVTLEETLVIGDSMEDALACQEAGVKMLLTDWEDRFKLWNGSTRKGVNLKLHEFMIGRITETKEMKKFFGIE